MASSPIHLPTAAVGTPILETDIPGKERRQALVVALGFFGIILGGAALIPLDAGAVASGRVTVSGHRQAVQHKDGGIVTSLGVREGQTVRKGQILMTISASELEAEERALASEYVTLLAQQARLRAERDGQAEVTPPSEFASIAPMDKAVAEDAMRLQRALFEARREAQRAQKSVLSQRARQSAEQASGFMQQRISNREQRRLLGDELAGMKTLEKRGFASTNRIRALERSAAALDGDHGALGAEIARSRAAMGELSMQSLSLDREMAEQVSEQLRDVTLRLDAVRPKLAAVRGQLAQAQIRAPASGKVIGLSAFTIGGIVTAGQVLMEIVPQDRELIIDAMVSPSDADDVSAGQQVQVRFSSIQERSLPILHGRVARLSADSFTDQRTGQQYFRAEIRVPRTELDKIRQLRPGRMPIQAGLPAEVLIPLRSRSALTFLVEPLSRSMWRTGRED